jgi:ubiquinone/menaquinone biosynthesis C-methylase UbiE
MKIAKIFDNAQLYKLFQYSVMKTGTTKIIRDEILKPNGVDTVLDFGCGIGYHSVEFPNAQYLGVEPIAGCVKKANQLFKSESTNFINGDHLTLKSIPDHSFELIIAIGVLHHIDDEIFSEFLKETYRILKPGGRLTTFDPVFHVGQSKFSRWVVSQDRGIWVRTTEDYLQPIINVFKVPLNYMVYSGLLRIPYDHISIEVTKEIKMSTN